MSDLISMVPTADGIERWKKAIAEGKVKKENFSEDLVWSAFVRDIPDERDQENLLTMMAEVVQGWGTHDAVTVLNSYRSDVINATAEGIVEFKDREYYFVLEDGNNRGTVLLGWEDHGRYEEPKPTIWTIAPKPDTVSNALLPGGNPAFLLKKWDLFLDRYDIKDLLRGYSYDRHFQPGGKTEDHYRDRAWSLGAIIVTEEHAKEIRELLERAVASEN